MMTNRMKRTTIRAKPPPTPPDIDLPPSHSKLRINSGTLLYPDLWNTFHKVDKPCLNFS